MLVYQRVHHIPLHPIIKMWSLLARNAAFSWGPNLRIGSITEAIEAANMSMDNGWGVMVGVPIVGTCAVSVLSVFGSEWKSLSNRITCIYCIYIYNRYYIHYYMVSSQNYVFRKKQNRCAKVIAAVFFCFNACMQTYVRTCVHGYTSMYTI